MALRIFDELPQGFSPTGTANQAAMQANRQHLCRASLPFAVERIKAGFEIVEKLRPGIEPLRCGKAHIIGVKRVGQDQLLPAVEIHPIGQVIGVGVCNIGKSSGFCRQPHGVF